MTALPPNNTDVYRFFYEDSVSEHVMTVRTPDGVAQATVADLVESFCSAFGTNVTAFTGTKADFQAAGTTFSSPLSSGDWNGFTWGSGASDSYTTAVCANLVGRSAGGHRCRLGMFGWNGSVSNFKVVGSELSGLAGTVSAILNAATNCFYAIDGTKPTWYEYIDVKPNDYWVRKAR